ncbi:uncharacterized protein LOC127803133 [Diospyros lotus]|uniref:uncharacterized protein LOC127803133 n=1 Tax=Diospyros lotus TaxID=55363 RepID=UPI0022575A91|nr:uncharacterized protein LOC127803133 [Diospyros lotus]
MLRVAIRLCRLPFGQGGVGSPMETTSYQQHFILCSSHRLDWPVNQIQLLKRNVPDGPGLAMRFIRDRALRRIATSGITDQRRSHRPRLFCVANSHSNAAMTDDKKSRLGDESSGLNADRNKEDEKLPPPPEKPLPGDCCGSGCVRCVWDVYYEELEAYNKLLSKSKSRADDDDPMAS